MKINFLSSYGKPAVMTMSKADHETLSHITLKGCPFKDYYALDLLKDLLQMYSWRLEKGREYNISEFLTLCSDTHAEAYRAIFEA